MTGIRNLIAGICCLLFVACKENTADETKEPADSTSITTPTEDRSLDEIIEDESTEPEYIDAKASGNKRIINERYGFAFEIPENWKASEKSNNGDGYFIETGEKDIDLRVYGANIQGNEIMAEMELKACERKEDFKFANGYPGIICYQTGDVYYYYDTPKTRITFYVNAPKNWQEKHAAVINSIAKSISEVAPG